MKSPRAPLGFIVLAQWVRTATELLQPVDVSRNKSDCDTSDKTTQARSGKMHTIYLIQRTVAQLLKL
uniref:Secreted protein n=1 Tax=Anguilla anguilla TaxID=7936 RepID=A0A0E9VF96_ANGAN